MWCYAIPKIVPAGKAAAEYVAEFPDVVASADAGDGTVVVYGPGTSRARWRS